MRRAKVHTKPPRPSDKLVSPPGRQRRGGQSAARLAVTSRPASRSSQSQRAWAARLVAMFTSLTLLSLPPCIPPYSSYFPHFIPPFPPPLPPLSPLPYLLYPLFECAWCVGEREGKAGSLRPAAVRNIFELCTRKKFFKKFI